MTEDLHKELISIWETKTNLSNNFEQRLIEYHKIVQEIFAKSENPESGNIVKFNCMIQDFLDDEICCPLYKKDDKILPSLYNDEVENDIIDDFYIQRKVYFGIPIPGKSYWAKEIYSSKYTESQTKEDTMEEEKEEEEILIGEKKKRKRSEFNLNNKKKEKTNPNEFKIKVFNEEDVFKVCELVEVIGFFHEEILENNMGLQKTIHLISYKKLKHPSLNQEIKIKNPRDLMLNYLGNYFDTLTSEYLLLHFISRIFNRYQNKPVGNLSLNISGFKNNFKIENLVENILPFYKIFDLNIENINKFDFIPSKDYENNKLKTGILQLCEGTCFIINETDLNEGGEIKGKGIENIKAIKQLIQYQSVPYNFSYIVNIDSDIPVLSISKGKSLFFDIFNISIKTKQINFFSNLNQFKKEDFIELRNYLAFVKYNLDYSIENVKEFVENDFIQERKLNSITPETFDNWLNLARLITLSFGEKHLTKDIWNRMKEMEKERLKRFDI
eukprot:gene10603-3121_t